jgi:hypothetical protein
MIGWANELFALLNDSSFQVTDPGCLHSPVLGLSLRRDDELSLVLKTKASPIARCRGSSVPLGTVQMSKDEVTVANTRGATAVLSGVITRTLSPTYEQLTVTELNEEAIVHQVSLTTASRERAAYTIEWLENLRSGPFIWPHLLSTEPETMRAERLYWKTIGSPFLGLPSQRAAVSVLPNYWWLANHSISAR